MALSVPAVAASEVCYRLRMSRTVKTFSALLAALVLIRALNAASAATPLHCTAPQNRYFDFWIGPWQVRNYAGKVEGTNSITREYGQCVLQEHFRSDDGSSYGSSFSFFDGDDGKWHYVWVDNLGAFEIFTGNMIGQSMVMTGWTTTPSHRRALERMTWTPLRNGRVRQFWQGSTDGGRAWQTISDVYYWRSR